MAVKKSATKSRLNGLHDLVAQVGEMVLLEALELQVPPQAADMAWITKFLKDNEITADVDDATMNTLRDAVKDELAVRRETKAAEIAARIVGTDDDDLAGVV